MFATPWRLQHGPLLDLGPHVIDLLDAALGSVVGIRAHGDAHRWVGLLLEHEGGAVSEASLTAYCALDPARAGVEVYTPDGVLEVTTVGVSASASATLVDEFVATARSGQPHALDVRHGLHLQRLLTVAAEDLDRGRHRHDEGHAGSLRHGDVQGEQADGPASMTDHSPVTAGGPSEVRRSATDVDAAWLTSVLADRGLLPEAARVVGVVPTPVGTGQMADTVRFALTYEPAGTGPATVVGKFTSGDPQSHATGRIMRAYEVEVRFYAEIAPRVAVRHPGLLFAAVDPEEAWFTLLLQDVTGASQATSWPDVTPTPRRPRSARWPDCTAPAGRRPTWRPARGSTGPRRTATRSPRPS